MEEANAVCSWVVIKVGSDQNRCALRTGVARDAPYPAVQKEHKALAPSALSMAVVSVAGSKDVPKLLSVAEGAHPTVVGVDVPNLGAINMHKAALSDV